MLTQRQKEILKIIVENYVSNAEPVGSKSICEQLDVSSATVRNDMAVLEKEGYIDKTHSSSGRVPLEKGYRFYVEYLMHETSDDEFETKSYELVDKVFANAIVEREDAIKKACSLLADITNYTSVALGPDKSNNRVSKIELVTLSDDKYLMIVVTDSGHVESKVVTFDDEDADPDEVKRVLEILNEVLVNTPISEVSYRLQYIVDNHLIQEFMKYRESIINNFIDAFMQFAESNYYISGSSNMLVQPEFQDSKKLKKLLDVFEQKDLVKVIKENDNLELQVKIGSETGIEELDDTTVISMPYLNENGEKGNIALVGPTRMDYKKVIPLLKYIAKDIEKYYKKDKKENVKKGKESDS
ncbi:MAG: heat-inducible transcriptional repressor HrcA [Gammaproteobacteria bacterium]|nr:heat-inducible transcriptional repressor HrcA [Gammaproteobacteria bacterium]